MQIKLGYDSFQLSKGKESLVTWDLAHVINAHWLLMGMPGSGKTHTIRKIINQIVEQGSADSMRVHVYDVHGDIEINNASTVMYSELSDYGINPLALNPDPHSGGVRKRVTSFLNVLESTTTKLGTRQQGVLRNLLIDLYQRRGFQPNNPDTWGLDFSPTQSNHDLVFLNIPFAEKDEAKQMGARWHPQVRSWYVESARYTGEIAQRWQSKQIETDHDGRHVRDYPTLADAVQFIHHKIEEAYYGVGKDAMMAIGEFHKATRSYNAKIAKSGAGGKVLLTEEEESQIEKAKDKVMTKVEAYLNSHGDERAVQDAITYSSIDTMHSLYQRLDALNSCGVFKSTPPPFANDAVVHRHHIKSLSADEQKLFVLFSIGQIFERAVQCGETKTLRDVIVIDEAAKFFDDQEDNPLNIIAREGRKFGLSLICASQNPKHFSDDFLSSVATKLVLGIDEMYWRESVSKLRIEIDKMKWVTPRREMLAQIKCNGVSQNNWVSVSLGKSRHNSDVSFQGHQEHKTVVHNGKSIEIIR